MLEHNKSLFYHDRYVDRILVLDSIIYLLSYIFFFLKSEHIISYKKIKNYQMLHPLM